MDEGGEKGKIEMGRREEFVLRRSVWGETKEG